MGGRAEVEGNLRKVPMNEWHVASQDQKLWWSCFELYGSVLYGGEIVSCHEGEKCSLKGVDF